MNIKELIKQFIFKFIKYLALIVLGGFFITNLYFFLCNKTFLKCDYIDKFYSKNEAKMIIILLPSIITTCTIALSLTSEKFYGVDAFTFRRLRKGLSFNFTEMFIIDVVLFALFLSSSILNFNFCLFLGDIVSLIYSFWLVIQEIPLLSKRKGYVEWIIKRILKDKNYKNGSKSEGKEKDSILESFYFQSGLKNSYLVLKYRKQKRNIELLNKLLDVNNDFLDKVINKKDYLISSKEINIENINILDAIKFSFDSVKDIFKFDKNFDVIKIFGNSSNHYKIASIIYKMKDICDFLSLNSSYDDFINGLFLSFEGKEIYKDDKYDDFKFRILNDLIFKTEIKLKSLYFIKVLKKLISLNQR